MALSSFSQRDVKFHKQWKIVLSPQVISICIIKHTPSQEMPDQRVHSCHSFPHLAIQIPLIHVCATQFILEIIILCRLPSDKLTE